MHTNILHEWVQDYGWHRFRKLWEIMNASLPSRRKDENTKKFFFNRYVIRKWYERVELKKMWDWQASKLAPLKFRCSTTRTQSGTEYENIEALLIEICKCGREVYHHDQHSLPFRTSSWRIDSERSSSFSIRFLLLNKLSSLQVIDVLTSFRKLVTS